MNIPIHFHRRLRQMAVLALPAMLLPACGGGSGCSPSDDKCPPDATIKVFTVSGNAAPVNGRAQIVADNSEQPFTMKLRTPTASSGDAAIWISDQEDLAATNLEQKIADISCTYYPFCEFNLSLACTFTPTSLVACTLASGGDGLIKTNFPLADIGTLLTGDQTNLFIVATTKGNGTTTAQKNVPVTFRYH